MQEYEVGDFIEYKSLIGDEHVTDTGRIVNVPPFEDSIGDNTFISEKFKIRTNPGGNNFRMMENVDPEHIVGPVDKSTEITLRQRVADSIAPHGARYVMECPSCGAGSYRERDSKTVKYARDDDKTLNCSCGGEFELIRDRQPARL